MDLKPTDYPGTSADFDDQHGIVTIAVLQNEITRLENENDRLTQENLDMARELGAKSEPVEYGC